MEISSLIFLLTEELLVMVFFLSPGETVSTYNRKRKRRDRLYSVRRVCVLPSLRLSSCESQPPAQLQFCSVLPTRSYAEHSNLQNPASYRLSL